MIKFMYDPASLTKSWEEIIAEDHTKTSADLVNVKQIETIIKKFCRKYNKKGASNMCTHCPLFFDNGFAYCTAKNVLYVISEYYKNYIDEKELKESEKKKQKRMQELSDWYDKQEKEMNETD